VSLVGAYDVVVLRPRAVATDKPFRKSPDSSGVLSPLELEFSVVWVSIKPKGGDFHEQDP
jgi:hypothetical protein